jgi:drug/metabolite transporter (DMT)-like permease
MSTIASAPTDEHHNVSGGILLMLVASLVFSANDALGKWLVGIYPVGQFLLFRSAAALIVLAPFVAKHVSTAGPAVKRPGMQVLRALLSVGDIAFFYIAVKWLPLADTMTYYLASPIFVTVLAALILREQVGWRRWVAVLAGFVGVMIILQPSAAAFGWPAFLALLGSICFAFLMIATRSLRHTPGVMLVAWPVAAVLATGVAAAPFGWVAVSVTDIALLGLAGVFSMIAAAIVNRSLKLAPASIVVPYQYTLIVWAALFGYLVFGDVPGPSVIVGATVIIGAGLFILLRERKVLRKPREDVLAEP